MPGAYSKNHINQEIIRLTKQGRTIKQIAKDLNKTELYVQQKIKNLKDGFHISKNYIGV